MGLPVTYMWTRLIQSLSLFGILFACAFGYAQTNPKILFDTGVEKVKQGAYQEAVDLFSDLIIALPDSAKAYKNRGVALMNLGNMDHAINDFQRALEINPNLKGIYSNLGAAWYYKGAHEKAIHNYTIAVKEDPESHIAYFNRALSRVALNQIEGAIEDLEKTLMLNPEFDPAVLALQDFRKLPAETGSETYAVQVGAFQSQSNAHGLKQRLIDQGVDATIQTFQDEKERTWYRVWCGNNLTLKAAQNLSDTLKNKYDIQTIIRLEHLF